MVKSMDTITEQDKDILNELPNFCVAGKAYGPTHVQRHMRIGYIRACHIIDRGVETGALVKDPEKDWLFCLPTAQNDS